MLGFVLGNSRSAGLSSHCITLLSTMVCWFSCGHKQVFRKANGDRCFSKFAWAPHFLWNMNLETHENIERRINSCATWRKMGINCAWRCWLKNKTSQSSSRSTNHSLLHLFSFFIFFFSSLKNYFFLTWNLELSASLKFRLWLKLLNSMVQIYFLCWYGIRLLFLTRRIEE